MIFTRLLPLLLFSLPAAAALDLAWPPQAASAQKLSAKDFGGDAKLLRDFTEARGLLQGPVRVLTGAAVAPSVAQALKTVFSTPTGRDSFCFLTLGDDKVLMQALGVSKKTADALRSECADWRPTPAQQAAAEAVMSPVAISRQTTLPSALSISNRRKFIFVAAESEGPIEGFTNRHGTTFVILKRNEFTAAHLTRLLAHELAVAFDQIAGLGDPTFAQAPEFWDVHIASAFGKDPFQSTFFPPRKFASVLCAIRDPILRYAAISERAFRFEDQVIREAGLEKHSPAVTDQNLSCTERLARWMPAFPFVSSMLGTEPNQDFYQRMCGKNLITDPDRGTTLVQDLKIVDRTSLETRDDRKSFRLCRLLIQPRVGPSFNPFSGGPRPRAGGWAGSESLTIQKNLAQALQGQKWNPQDLQSALNPRLDPIFTQTPPTSKEAADLEKLLKDLSPEEKERLFQSLKELDQRARGELQ